MMVVHGIGIDVIEVERVEQSLAQHGERFLQRMFTAAEQDYCLKQHCPARHFAARFAAKEAVAKALGTGIGAQVHWTDIEIKRGERGEPVVQMHGRGKDFCDQLGITVIVVSLSHAHAYAAASALASKSQS